MYHQTPGSHMLSLGHQWNFLQALPHVWETVFTRLFQGSFGSKKQKATQVYLKKKSLRSTNKCRYHSWAMFLCAWHCTSTITFNTHNNPLRQMVIIIHFLDGGTESSESDTITGRAGIPTERVWL